MRKSDLLAELTDVMSDGGQLEDRRKVGESSCNFGDGTDQRVQSLMFMMMKCLCLCVCVCVCVLLNCVVLVSVRRYTWYLYDFCIRCPSSCQGFSKCKLF